MKNKKEKKILVIAEGEKTEPQIYGDLLVKTGLLPEDISIFSYKASLHDLIRLLDETQNLDFSDFKQSLVEREREKCRKILEKQVKCLDEETRRCLEEKIKKDLEEKIKKLQEKYTDTILLFDLDPQDKQYNPAKVVRLLKAFNESSDNGKLYLSYPMIEALFDDRDFVPFPLKGKRYKNHVKNNNDLYGSFAKNKLTFKHYQNILKNQFAKAGKITPYNDDKFHRKLFCKQRRKIRNKKIYIISTALFFLIDYWGNKVMQVNSSEEL